MLASSSPSWAAYGLSRSKSEVLNSTTKSFGTTVLSRFQIVALLSHSRCRAPAISTGWTSDLKTLAKVQLTRPSRRCSNFFRTPMGHLLLLLAGLAGLAGPGRLLFPLLLLLP